MPVIFVYYLQAWNNTLLVLEAPISGTIVRSRKADRRSLQLDIGPIFGPGKRPQILNPCDP